MSRPLAVTIVDRDGMQHAGEFVVTTGELDTPLWRGVVNPVPEGMRPSVAETEGSPLLEVTVRLEEGARAGHIATAKFGAHVPDGAELAGLTPFRAPSP
jgi:hypothetical protein